MSLSPTDLITLSALPCFKESVHIESLTSGMSHTCVKVISSTQCFFAKRLNKTTAKVEVLCAHFASISCVNNSLTPAVIYYDEHWLVTEFIDGVTITNSQVSMPDKLSIGLHVIARLHQLPPVDHPNKIPSLAPYISLKELIYKNKNVFKGDLASLEGVAGKLNLMIEQQLKQKQHANLLCHGDVNFSNILLDKSNSAWLIDFECAHLAPREFDIAMFIAVNNINTTNIEKIVKLYENLVPNTTLDTTLLAYYLLYSYFINGLWYLGNISELDNKTMFLSLAREQWHVFDDCVAGFNSRAINIPNISHLLTTNN